MVKKRLESDGREAVRALMRPDIVTVTDSFYSQRRRTREQSSTSGSKHGSLASGESV
jgi:hypothetical protein